MVKLRYGRSRRRGKNSAKNRSKCDFFPVVMGVALFVAMAVLVHTWSLYSKGTDNVNLRSLRLTGTLDFEQYDGPKNCDRKATKGDTITINYVGSIHPASKQGVRGKVIESSEMRGKPLIFVLGEGSVLDGLEMSLPGLCVGAKIYLEVPPQYGYGNEGKGSNVPGGTTLFFDIQVVDIAKTKAKNSQIQNKKSEVSEHSNVENNILEDDDYKPKPCVVCDVPKDVRHPMCIPEMSRIQMEMDLGNVKLPTTSVIFTFCNEPTSSLYYSIHSVLERSPPHLLKEIILVDDGSYAANMKQPLEDYIKQYPKVKLIRQNARTGLMRARNAGAKVATGDVLTFLDSHISPQRNWLEPLLYRIAQDRKHVVMPMIDGLSRKFEYNKGGIALVGFNTQLQDHGINLQEKDKFEGRSPVDPQPSPAMAGGLFALSREYFHELGGFDDQMQHWGGENIEFSLRIWQCGGSLELIPCSRVAHIFGGMTNPQRCSWPGGGGANLNKWRTIKVWMDDYDVMFKKYLYQPRELGDLSKMKALRKRLQCKSFQWFLDNVYPECWINAIKNPLSKGKLQLSSNKDKCVKILSSGRAKVMHCAHGQRFFYTKKQELMLSNVDDCVEGRFTSQNHGTIWRYACHGQGGNQMWKYNSMTGVLVHRKECLTVETEGDGTNVSLRKCNNPPSENQVWSFVD